MDRTSGKKIEPIPPMSPIDRIVEAMGLVAMVGCVVLVAVGTMVAPEQMPMHFGADGTPDRYASKVELWVLLGVMALLFVMLWLPTRFIDRLRPHATEEWLARNDRQVMLARSLLLWVALEFAALLNLMIVGMLEVATFRALTLDTRPLWLVTGAVAVTLAVYAVLAVREHRRETGGLQT